MLSSRLSSRIIGKATQCFARNYRVAVVGAAGGIGQPMSLLLKQNELVTELNCYDVAPVTPGVAADLSHCDTPAKAFGFAGPEAMDAALKDCDVVVVPAGVPRKPGMDRQDLFNVNASICQGVAESVSRNCPNAAVLVISNPVNSTVPIMAEAMKAQGTYNPKKLFGVTTLDVVRANTFVAENQGFDVRDTNVTVIGGHAGITILPLLSRVQGATFSEEDKAALTQRIMFGGDEVVKAKAGGGSATLSMAYAAARFTDSLIKGMNGQEGVVECAYVESNVTECTYFSTPLVLGPNGVEKNLGLGNLDAFEQEVLAAGLAELKGSIKKGEQFAANF